MRSLATTLLFALAFATACFVAANGQVKAAEFASGQSEYRIKQGDKLSVKFFTNSELNEPSLSVRPDGYISLQIINDVKAEGLTTGELRKILEKAYSEVLLDPIISVALTDFVQPRIFIAGQINKPGRYELREAKTLMQAIFGAGGFTRDANRTMVILARPDGNGDWKIQQADAMALLDPKKNERDLELRDGDYVYVPESKMAKFNRAVEIVRGLLPRFY